jgi:hypothetical protein
MGIVRNVYRMRNTGYEGSNGEGSNTSAIHRIIELRCLRNLEESCSMSEMETASPILEGRCVTPAFGASSAPSFE